MKGFIFTNFIDFVEKSNGLEMVDQMLSECSLESEGVYSAFVSYKFEELVTLLTYVSQKTNISPQILLESFGRFVFPYLIGKHSYIVEKYKNPLDLLAGIENHIHIEVKKLYEDAELPTFNVVERKDNSLTIIYTSTRGLTYFAIGLMKETLQFFKVNGTIDMVENYNNNGSVKFLIQLH
ncbi:MAG: heme NO-binding domain-containing protein [Patiriisocius sp.]